MCVFFSFVFCFLFFCFFVNLFVCLFCFFGFKIILRLCHLFFCHHFFAFVTWVFKTLKDKNNGTSYAVFSDDVTAAMLEE